MFDEHSNFGISNVVSPPSPDTTGNRLSVTSGDGANFPTPPFNATVWQANTLPKSTNAEIVRVTAKSGDVFTISRTQENSTARSIVTGDQIAASITKKTLTDIESNVGSNDIFVTVGSSGADYTTDGVADDVQIQEANDAIASTGGTILIKTGVYDITSTINLSQKVRVTGEGIGTKLTSNGAVAIFTLPSTDPSGNPVYVTIENLRFWGSNSSNTGIDCGSYGQEFIIRSCWFHKWGIASKCITTTTNKKFLIIGNFFGGDAYDDANTNAIGTAINLSATGDVAIIGNDIHQFVKAISGNTEKTQISGNDIYSGIGSQSPDTIAINLGTVSGGLQIANVVNNTFSDCDVGVKCSQAAGTGGLNISGNFFRNINGNAVSLRGAYHTVTNNYFQNVARTLTGNNAMGILLADSTQYINVSNNSLYNTHTNMTYGISLLDVSSGNNTVVNNYITGAQTADIRVGSSTGNTVRNATTSQLNGEATHTLSLSQNSSTNGAPLIIQAGQSAAGLTNATGGALQLKSGVGTGNASNVIQFFTATDTGSGATAQSYSEKFRISSTSGGRISLGGIAPTTDFEMSGEQARTIRSARRTGTNTAGNNTTLASGGATSGATDKNAGSLILQTGISTGTGTSTILFKTADVGSTGTSDNTVNTRATIDNNGLAINSGVLNISNSKTPSSASDTGTTGDIAWDSSFIYVCIATNTWKRVGISTW